MSCSVKTTVLSNIVMALSRPKFYLFEGNILVMKILAFVISA